MFVVGVVGAVGGVIAGAASHDDYSDWKDHHQYNDAGVLADIKSKRELILSEEKALENMKKRLREQLRESISAVATNEEVAVALQKIVFAATATVAEAAIKGENKISEQVRQKMLGIINDEIKRDQQCLDKINEAILRINEYKLR